VGSRVISIALMSSKGAANAADSVCARSVAETAPELVSSATKLLLAAVARLEISSAAACVSVPAMTSARAMPGSTAAVAMMVAGALLALSVVLSVESETAMNLSI